MIAAIQSRVIAHPGNNAEILYEIGMWRTNQEQQENALKDS